MQKNVLATHPSRGSLYFALATPSLAREGIGAVGGWEGQSLTAFSGAPFTQGSLGDTLHALRLVGMTGVSGLQE